MPKTVQLCATEGTACQISDLIAIQLEPGQALGVPEPGPSQAAQSVIAKHQHPQTLKLAEGAISERRAGYLVVLQQQCPQLGEAMQGVFLNILDAISAQGEQGKIKQEGQVCALYRGEVSISDD